MAFIPTQCKSNEWKALTFLNGFEISSVNPKGNFYTPYEVQAVVKGVSVQGITVLISTTSATQIHALFVSYIAYDPSIKNVFAKSVVYDEYVGIKTHQHEMDTSVNMHVMFCGVSSFIISNNGATFGLSISMNDLGSVVNTASNFYYFSYADFSLMGGKCGQCVGYNIYHDGNCVDACPPNSYYNGEKCITCGTNQVWDGAKCVDKAPVVPVKPVGPVISCPKGTWWDQQQLRCLPCPDGCMSCPDCYSCDSCSPGYYLPSANSLCEEVCGDGKRFTLECDDGNNINGDGCSSTCEL